MMAEFFKIYVEQSQRVEQFKINFEKLDDKLNEKVEVCNA